VRKAAQYAETGGTAFLSGGNPQYGGTGGDSLTRSGGGGIDGAGGGGGSYSLNALVVPFADALSPDNPDNGEVIIAPVTSVAPVPEPTSIAMLGSAWVLLALKRKRKSSF
jgi:hypothetical protein